MRSSQHTAYEQDGGMHVSRGREGGREGGRQAGKEGRKEGGREGREGEGHRRKKRM